jgi:hypothetical protein
LTILVLAVLVVGLISAGAWFYDQRRRRRDEARQLETQVMGAFQRDPRLTGLALTASASVPMTPGKPVTIALAGSVPSAELRRVVLQTADEEMKQSGYETVLEDGLMAGPDVSGIAA